MNDARIDELDHAFEEGLNAFYQGKPRLPSNWTDEEMVEQFVEGWDAGQSGYVYILQPEETP